MRDGVYKLASRGGMALTLLHQFSSLGFRNDHVYDSCASLLLCREVQSNTIDAFFSVLLKSQTAQAMSFWLSVSDFEI
jgi:hypothetical protein